MEVVLNNLGFNINRKSHKPAQYFKLMTTKYDEVINMFKSLDLKETNISLLFEYLDEIMADERDKTK